MSNNYIGKNSLTRFLERLYETFSKKGHAHSKADILDFPDIPAKVSELENDANFITSYTETDPTVPAWAKAETKPTYTASEVGALPADTVIPTVPTKVSAFTNDAGYLTSIPDVYITESELNDKCYLNEDGLFVALNRYDVIHTLVDDDGAYIADEFGAVLFGDDECACDDNGMLEEIYENIEKKISDLKPDDYVIEAGVSGIWTYEKWHSGKSICFGTYVETLTNYTTINGFNGYYSSKVTYPTKLFISPPVMMHSSKVGNGFVIDGGDVQNSKDSATAYALCTTSGEAKCVWNFYCVGRWK